MAIGTAALVRMLVHVAVVLLMPPLLLGFINRTKAIVAGRRGAPLLQPYYDLIRLAKKGAVQSGTTTWVFRAGPVVGLATAIVAALIVPVAGQAAPLAFAGDLVLFAYVLGLGRFFTISAALDTGSAFEGMGSAREATYACLAEPALFLGLLVLTRQSGALSLSPMLGPVLAVEWHRATAPFALLLASLFIVLLVECSRIPFDDPNTHLELTMIHEVMVLDHSGPAFGMILYGASIKLFVLGALIAQVAIPMDGSGLAASYGVFIATMLGIAVAIGIVESVTARLRLVRIPRLLVAACLFSALALALAAR